jgi:RHS repeat-associated protein
MKPGNGVGREPAPDVATYTYAGMGYANPHDLTQLSSGYSTSTFVYDNDGNVAQKTTDGTTTTYAWDYANRLIALGVAGQGTTTFGYDYAGTRVYQIIPGVSTTTYPWKYFSVASTTKSGTNFSTSTEYVFNGDTLLSTIDQGFKNGAATGTPITHFIHPDHLGSTNIVTDASGTVVETLDYFPYGATRVSSGQNATSRQFIGQFTDPSTLSYLNARYYNSSQGQFLSQDAMFLVGQPKQQRLQDPQSLNSYSYSEDNPVTRSDPYGRWAIPPGVSVGVFPFSINFGLLINNTGVDYQVSGGIDIGAGLALPLFTSGDVPHTVQESLVQGASLTVGPGISVDRSTNINCLDPSTWLNNNNPTYDYTTNAGLEASYYSLLFQLTVPIFGGQSNSENVSTPRISQNNSYNQFSSYSQSTQNRNQAVQSYNSSIGGVYGQSPGGYGYSSSGTPLPNPNSAWTTPSGAVVTWSGQLVSGPPQSK